MGRPQSLMLGDNEEFLPPPLLTFIKNLPGVEKKHRKSQGPPLFLQPPRSRRAVGRQEQGSLAVKNNF